MCVNIEVTSLKVKENELIIYCKTKRIIVKLYYLNEHTKQLKQLKNGIMKKKTEKKWNTVLFKFNQKSAYLSLHIYLMLFILR